MAKKWHKKQISTKWGIVIIGFLLISVAVLIPVLKESQQINSEAALCLKPPCYAKCASLGGKTGKCKYSYNNRATKCGNGYVADRKGYTDCSIRAHGNENADLALCCVKVTSTPKPKPNARICLSKGGFCMPSHGSCTANDGVVVGIGFSSGCSGVCCAEPTPTPTPDLR